MAKELDAHVEEFRTRSLAEAGPFTFVAADALVLKVREGGRVVPVHALVATGVNADGHREILGIQVTTSEDGAGWLAFFRDLTARGLSGVKLVTSDAHAGLVAAIEATLPGAVVATVPHPLRREPDVRDPEVQLGLGQGAAALDLRPARRRRGARPVRPRRRRPDREAPQGRRAPRDRPRRHPGLHRVPQGDLAPDLVQQPQRAAQPRDPPPHRRRRASSPTATRSSGSSAPSSPSSTTNGPKAAATSDSTSSPAPKPSTPAPPRR